MIERIGCFNEAGAGRPRMRYKATSEAVGVTGFNEAGAGRPRMQPRENQPPVLGQLLQ